MKAGFSRKGLQAPPLPKGSPRDEAGPSAATDKRTCLCECTRLSFVAADTVSLEFIWPGPAPRGGQFFLIKPNRSRVFLARPISAAGWKPRRASAFGKNGEPRSGIDRRKKSDRRVTVERRLSADRRLSEGGIVRFLVTRRGQGSRDIVDIRPGEEAELTGPLGNFWPVADIPRGPIALVSGGIGIAPLLAAAGELGRRPYDFYAGFRTGSYGLEHIRPRALIVATEDGSQGVKGRIPDFFTPSGYSGVFVCGPEPMLKVIADVCIAGGVPCFISVEKHMACGVGACLGCTIRTLRGNRSCCSDGPVFEAGEVLF